MAGEIILPMDESALDGLAELERTSFSMPWSRKSLEDELENPNAHNLVAWLDGRVAGYIGVWEILGEASINSVAVFPELRRRGIAKRLLCTAEREAIKRGCVSMTLEVRRSNHAAASLYESCGYARTGVRKNFYSAPAEDGIIMTKELTLFN